MELRKLINGNPAVAGGVVAVVVVAAGWFAWSQLRGMGGSSTGTGAFYSIDDGKTWFVDEPRKITPFEKDGKQACGVQVVQCGDEEPFVAYLIRYTEKGKAVTEKFRAEQAANPGRPPASIGAVVALGEKAMEYKRPGDKEWVVGGNAKVQEIRKPVCKGGGEPRDVNP